MADEGGVDVLMARRGLAVLTALGGDGFLDVTCR